MSKLLESRLETRIERKSNELEILVNFLNDNQSAHETAWSKTWSENNPGPWQQSWNNWTQLPS